MSLLISGSYLYKIFFCVITNSLAGLKNFKGLIMFAFGLHKHIIYFFVTDLIIVYHDTHISSTIYFFNCYGILVI